MNFDKLVESIIQEAIERGEFKNLSGAGKPIDLTPYFDTPEETRVAHAVLKNAGMTTPEVELLNEIAGLRRILVAMLDEQKRQKIQKQIQQKQIELNLMIERQRKRKSR